MLFKHLASRRAIQCYIRLNPIRIEIIFERKSKLLSSSTMRIRTFIHSIFELPLNCQTGLILNI